MSSRPPAGGSSRDEETYHGGYDLPDDADSNIRRVWLGTHGASKKAATATAAASESQARLGLVAVIRGTLLRDRDGSPHGRSRTAIPIERARSPASHAKPRCCPNGKTAGVPARPKDSLDS